jgi:cyanophycin synthetase
MKFLSLVEMIPQKRRLEPAHLKATNTVLKMIGRPLVVPGFSYGLRYPALLFRVVSNAAEVPKSLIHQGDTCVVEALRSARPNQSVSVDPDASGRLQSLPVALLYWMEQLQGVAELPIFECGRIVRVEGRRSIVCVPALAGGHQATAAIFTWLLELLNRLSAEQEVVLHLDKLSGRLKALKDASPLVANVPGFLRAAYEMGVPFQELPGQVVQYGYGARARWMDSSFTDQTPAIGAKLARNKLWAAAVLRRAGIPVPRHALVSSSEMAVDLAKTLQYPVVIKPADKDGGLGVAAGLTTPEEVREAFLGAQKYSRNVLVEKHFAGKDYRLTVFQGQLIWAIERIPGGVNGDGVGTVRELVDQLNADPRRGQGPHAPLKRLVFNDEAWSLLHQIGLDENSVPGPGVFVRLRRTANVANGGMPVAVFEQVHPDNNVLAVRAAAALHLDLAGVDLLIPDICRSWREAGAIVCEVNAQPNLGQTTSAHLYKQILAQLVQGNGRIPTVAIVGAAAESTLAKAICSCLQLEGLVVGRADLEGVTVDDLRVFDGPISPYAGGQILLADQRVEAVVLGINDRSILRTGLPFDQFDVLVLAGQHLRLDGLSDGLSREQVCNEMCNILVSACAGKVLTVAEPGIEAPSPPVFNRAEWVNTSLPPDQVAEAVVQAMLEAESRHRSGSL